MAVFSSGGVGFDLGSSNVTIFLENEGVVLREPSLILNNVENSSDIIAFGREARQMVGRTPRDVELTQPVMNGAVTDIEQASALIQAMCDKAIGRRRSLEKSRLVVTMPQDLTRVEYEALKNAVHMSGARRAALVRTPIAAAVGAGVQISDPKGIMMVVIGGNTTEIAVLSMNGIVAARSVRAGSAAFDEAIVRYVRREKGLIIGLRTAEDIKIDIGAAVESRLTETFEVLLRGRDASTGKPSTVSITAKDVYEALKRPADDIVESIREAFENTPPELCADILERGIQLSGGGSCLEGLAKRISEATKLPVRTSEEPQDDVAAGAGIIASDDRLYTRFMQSGCVMAI